MNIRITLVLLVTTFWRSPTMVDAIGEGQLDVNKVTGILGGLGNMFRQVKTEDIDVNKMMGRWFQMYKAAMTFDVFRTNMFCPVAYFRENPVMGADGFSIQEAYRVISKSGPIETYKQDLTRAAPGSYWMYTEEYFYPRQFFIMKVGPDYLLPNKTTTNASEVESDDDKTPLLYSIDKAEALQKERDRLLNLGSSKNSIGQGDDEDVGDVAIEDQYEYMIVTDGNRLSLAVYARDPIQFYSTYNKPILDYLETQGFGGSVFWNAPRPIYQGPDCLWPTEREVFARRVLKNEQRQKQNEQLQQQRQNNQQQLLASRNAAGVPSPAAGEQQPVINQAPVSSQQQQDPLASNILNPANAIRAIQDLLQRSQLVNRANQLPIIGNVNNN